MTSLLPYEVLTPTQGPRRPILVSVPHCGTAFPDDIRAQLNPAPLATLDDTDWFVDQLYDFVQEMGITMIRARYHRYVIDLNRDPKGTPLYDDGRVITELVPTRTFLDQPLYGQEPPDTAEIEARKTQYFDPYHEKIRALLTELQQDFPEVLLWDAHSIRKQVPTLHADPFPDLILGDQDSLTAAEDLIAIASDQLCKVQGTSFSHNIPFSGGYITRSFGQPQDGIHALQLEMVKPLYMNEQTGQYDPSRAEPIREVLQQILSDLAHRLEQRVIRP